MKPPWKCSNEIQNSRRSTCAPLEEIAKPGGEAAFLAALRQVALARGGITQIADATGMKREAVSRALSPRGNPTLKTLATVCHAIGVRLDAHIA